MNKNVGRSTANNAGLILQAKPEISKDETGLRQCTFKFDLLNTAYTTLDPLRGVACPGFVTGSTRTASILAEFPYLAAQSSVMHRDAVAQGIGQLDVLCQGAIFTYGPADDPQTPPFFSSTVVKDTQQFTVYSIVGTGTNYPAFVCATTGMLSAFTSGIYYGFPGLRANTHGFLPMIDDFPVGRGDLILIPTGSSAGVYKVLSPGGNARYWVILKVAGSEPTTGQNVQVAAGEVNAGLWSFDSDSGNYVQSDSPAQNTPRYEVTVEYRALELSFEYVASKYTNRPRYLQPAGYILSDNGIDPLADSNFVVIDRATGVGLAMFRDSIMAAERIASGSPVQVTDGAEVAFGTGKKQLGEKIVNEAQNFVTNWTSFARLTGDNSEFIQTPAGRFWSVKETITIKYAAHVPIGSVVSA